MMSWAWGRRLIGAGTYLPLISGVLPEVNQVSKINFSATKLMDLHLGQVCRGSVDTIISLQSAQKKAGMVMP